MRRLRLRSHPLLGRHCFRDVDLIAVRDVDSNKAKAVATAFGAVLVCRLSAADRFSATYREVFRQYLRSHWLRRSHAGRVPRSFARPNKMRDVGSFKSDVAGFGKTQLLLRTAAMAHVSGRRGNEIQIMHVKSENAQEPRQTRQVAANDPLQVRDAAAAPLLQIVAAQQLHSNKHINRSNDLVLLKDKFDRAADPRKQRVVAKCCHRHRPHLMI